MKKIIKKQIKIKIKFKNLSDKTVATAHRICDKKKLIEGNIDINRKKCYYPDNLFYTYNNFLFITLFIIGILFHSLYFIIIIDILKIEEVYKPYCGNYLLQ